MSDNPNIVLRVGAKVRVTRQVGNDGIPHEVTGTLRRFCGIIYINGERTATIDYDDGGSYEHPLSKILPVESTATN